MTGKDSEIQNLKATHQTQLNINRRNHEAELAAQREEYETALAAERQIKADLEEQLKAKTETESENAAADNDADDTSSVLAERLRRIQMARGGRGGKN